MKRLINQCSKIKCVAISPSRVRLSMDVGISPVKEFNPISKNAACTKKQHATGEKRRVVRTGMKKSRLAIALIGPTYIIVKDG